MKRTTTQRISDIIEHIEKILLSTKGKTLEDLEEDYILVAAVIRWLEIIGEATKYVPTSLKEQYPNIPWREMAGMRDIANIYKSMITKDQISVFAQKFKINESTVYREYLQIHF